MFNQIARTVAPVAIQGVRSTAPVIGNAVKQGALMGVQMISAYAVVGATAATAYVGVRHGRKLLRAAAKVAYNVGNGVRDGIKGETTVTEVTADPQPGVMRRAA